MDNDKQEKELFETFAAQYPGMVPWDDEFLVRRGNYLTMITPEVAGKLLELNLNNRRPKRRKIDQYKRDMDNLRWDADASDLKVSRTQELVDGQNRCIASRESGMPFPTLIRTGIGLATKVHVDTGSARIGSDVVRMMAGVTNYSAGVSAAITLRHRYMERYERYDAARGLDWKSSTLTHDEVLSYLQDHPAITEMAPWGNKLYQSVTPVIQMSVWTAALSWFAELDHSAAEDYANRLVESAFGGPGDPLQSLISYAARARAQVQPGIGLGGIRGRIAQEENLIACIKVWNAIRSGGEIKKLTVRKDERLVIPR